MSQGECLATHQTEARVCHCERSEAISQRFGIASSLTLLAMTVRLAMAGVDDHNQSGEGR